MSMIDKLKDFADHFREVQEETRQKRVDEIALQKLQEREDQDITDINKILEEIRKAANHD